MKQFNYLVCLTIGLLLLGCGTASRITNDNRIIIKDKPYHENFTNDQLRMLIKKMRSEEKWPTIVVRGSEETGSISSSSAGGICSILETALSKNRFDVRDRSLFENIAKSRANNSTSVSYRDLAEATDVDLLMEVSNYSMSDHYYVDGYYDPYNRFHKFERVNLGTKKQPQWISPRYVLRGMSLTIKVIVLKDNYIGGAYSYSYVPCAEERGGGIITQMYPLRYRAESEVDAELDDDRNSSLIQTRQQRMNKEMELFLIKEVIPSIMSDMEGVSHQMGEAYSSTNRQMTGSSEESRNELNNVSSARELMKQSGASEKDTEKIMKNIEVRSAKPESKKSKSGSGFSEIVPKNVAGKVTATITEMIERKVAQQVEEERSKLKKQKDIDAFNTKIDALLSTFDKWNYLNINSLNDLTKFILSSLSPAGDRVPKVEKGEIFFFLPMRGSVNVDSVFFLFLDGQCIGIGSDEKGFYSCWNADSFSSSFHKLVVMGVNPKTGFKKELFESEVHFDMRNDFVFSREPMFGPVRLLKL